jgi:hypothetical protein
MSVPWAAIVVARTLRPSFMTITIEPVFVK